MLATPWHRLTEAELRILVGERLPAGSRLSYEQLGKLSYEQLTELAEQLPHKKAANYDDFERVVTGVLGSSRVVKSLQSGGLDTATEARYQEGMNAGADDMLTRGQVAALLSISLATVDRWRHEGLLVPVYVAQNPRLIRFRRSDVVALLNTAAKTALVALAVVV